MALINTLRKRMGKIVVFAVGFSMVAFILTDLLNTNSGMFTGSNDIGEINGESISYQEFQNKVDELSNNFFLNTGRNPLSGEMEQLRQQAWQELIIDNLFVSEFDKIGIEVSESEIVDMVQGQNIHPQIQQFFVNPETGVFDRQSVITFLQNLNNAPQNQRASWLAFEATLAPGRLMSKYENLLERSRFANKIEAQQEYYKTGTMSVDYLYIPFFSISDTLFTVTDDELEAYLNENPDDYQRQESKIASYVEFPIIPSSEDSILVKEEIDELVDLLATADDDSIFASINSDGLTPFGTYKPNNMPAWLTEEEGDLTVGYVSSPKLVGNTYSFFKVTEITEGDEAFVKASHILFKADDDSESAKAEARREARNVLRQIRNGADFALMAGQYGTDGTASRGGELGWIGEEGSYVQEFKDAIFAHRGSGLLRDVVETEFGYHIIRIDEPKTNRVYKIATIEKDLFVSDKTLNDTYRQAELFVNGLNDLSEFLDKAEAEGIRVREAPRVSKNDKRFGAIQEARTIVFWMFNKAEVGDISDVFELDDKYVVAVLKSEQNEGTANLTEVRAQVNRKVIDQKKSEMIMDKLNGLTGSLEEIKEVYGEGARTGNTELTFSSNSFPGVGYAPEAIGIAFSLEEGESTLPFEVQNGVLMVSASSKNVLEELADYEAYRGVVLNQTNYVRRREEPFTFQNVYDALVKAGEIEDNRYKFY